MKIYIRHAEKAYANGKAEEFKLDPPLAPTGRIAAKERALELVKKYGHPTTVVVSPYLRTRETAEVMLEAIEGNVTKVISPLYGEYVGWNRNVDFTTNVRPETLCHNPFHEKSLEEFNRRIELIPHSSLIEGTTWYITHGIVITYLAAHYHVFVNQVYYLSALIVNGERADLV